MLRRPAPGSGASGCARVVVAADCKQAERFPQRVRCRPLVISEAGDYVDVRVITDFLDTTRRHGPKKLGMAFRGNLHKISQGDYDQIEGLLQERVPVS